MTLRGNEACASRYGHIRAASAGHLLPIRLSKMARGTSLASSASMIEHSPGVLDQGQVGRCLPTAGVVAIYAGLHAEGLPTILGDPALAYRTLLSVRRAAMGLDLESNPLVDTGSMPEEFEIALKEFGLAPMQPDDPEAALNEVDLSALESEAMCKMDGAYVITTPDDFCLALQNKIVPTAAFDVYDPFEEYTGGRVLDVTDMVGPQRGAHDVACFAFETLSNGQRIFTWQNSWGTGFGDGGYFRTTEAWVARCFDARAMKMRRIQ